jgi:alkylation response protein AidB-like acyl-CoA dehydrogenase
MGLRATSTAAVTITNVKITGGRIIHPDANAWLPTVRPAFLGLQCGMSIGLARRALHEARGCFGPGRDTLAEPVADLAEALATQERTLLEGLRSGHFESKPAALFHIRIALSEIVAQALALELRQRSGQAYLTAPGASFGRRWREATFIPVITPSLVQLKTVLAAQRQCRT